MVVDSSVLDSSVFNSASVYDDDRNDNPVPKRQKRTISAVAVQIENPRKHFRFRQLLHSFQRCRHLLSPNRTIPFSATVEQLSLFGWLSSSSFFCSSSSCWSCLIKEENRHVPLLVQDCPGIASPPPPPPLPSLSSPSSPSKAPSPLEDHSPSSPEDLSFSHCASFLLLLSSTLTLLVSHFELAPSRAPEEEAEEDGDDPRKRRLPGGDLRRRQGQPNEPAAGRPAEVPPAHRQQADDRLSAGAAGQVGDKG